MDKENDVLEIYNDIEKTLVSININNNDDDLISSIKKKSEMPVMEDILLPENNNNNVKEKKLLNIKLVDPSKIDNDLNLKMETNEKNEETDKKEEIKKEVKNKKDEKTSKPKKSKKKIIGVTIFSFMDLVAIVCLFLMYGPISYFRNLWVTSAMTTMSHKYLAYIFFNEKSINRIMADNIVIEPEGESNKEDIDTNTNKNEQEILSPHDEEVLTRDPGNDIYKVIDIEGNGYKGHLLVVYDPKNVEIAQVPNLKAGGMQLPNLIKKNNGLAGINASGFSYNASYEYTPVGVVIIDGEIVCDNGDTGWGGGIIGFTNDDKLVLTKASAKEAIDMGIRDAVSFGPFLIVNGEPATFKGNGGYGIAPRSAIGQRKDGIVLLLVIDGRRPGHSLGVDMAELTNILLDYGAYNASNLDGGGSSSMVVDGEVISVAGGYGYTGERYLPNGWIVKDNSN